MALSNWRTAIKDPARYQRIVERLNNPDEFQDSLMKVMDLYEKEALVRMRDRSSTWSDFDRGVLYTVDRIRELMKGDPQ